MRDADGQAIMPQFLSGVILYFLTEEARGERFESAAATAEHGAHVPRARARTGRHRSN